MEANIKEAVEEAGYDAADVSLRAIEKPIVEYEDEQDDSVSEDTTARPLDAPKAGEATMLVLGASIGSLLCGGMTLTKRPSCASPTASTPTAPR